MLFVGMRWWVAFAVASFVVLHQDFWFWTTATPLVFGFLPVGLFYHAVYSLGGRGADVVPRPVCLAGASRT